MCICMRVCGGGRVTCESVYAECLCLSEFCVCGVCMRGYVYLSLCACEYMNVHKSILGTIVYVSVYTCVSRQEHARVCRATI